MITGRWLVWIADRCCGRETRARVFEPLLADWQREYLEARARSRVAAVLVLVRGSSAFAITLLICANPFRGPEGAPMRRFASVVVSFAVAATFLQSAPFQTMRVDPRFLASGIALAILPAAILAANQLNWSRLTMAMMLAVATALGINRWTREIHTGTAFVVFAVALGLLGTAIGRAQRGTSRPRATLLLPLSTAVWLPPLVVLLIAVVALAKTNGGAEAPPLHLSRS